jgi:hypothetical protein
VRCSLWPDSGSRGLHHLRQDAFKVLEHVHRTDAQRENGVAREKSIAGSVPARTVAALMRFAVNLHAKLGQFAIEIEIIGARWMLFSPVQSGLIGAQLSPQHDLGQRHFAAQSFCAPIGLAGALEHGWSVTRGVWQDKGTSQFLPSAQRAGEVSAQPTEGRAQRVAVFRLGALA